MLSLVARAVLCSTRRPQHVDSGPPSGWSTSHCMPGLQPVAVGLRWNVKPFGCPCVLQRTVRAYMNPVLFCSVKSSTALGVASTSQYVEPRVRCLRCLSSLPLSAPQPLSRCPLCGELHDVWKRSVSGYYVSPSSRSCELCRMRDDDGHHQRGDNFARFCACRYWYWSYASQVHPQCRVRPNKAPGYLTVLRSAEELVCGWHG
jgi:hypothetical protein